MGEVVSRPVEVEVEEMVMVEEVEVEMVAAEEAEK